MKKLALTAIIALMIASTASANPKFSPDLEEKINNTQAREKVPIILRLNNSPGQSQRQTIRNTQASIKAEHNSINAITIEVPKQAAENLANLEFVQRMEPDYNIKTVLDESTRQINTKKVWQNQSGEGIDIAIIDTGIADNNQYLDVERQIDFTGEGTDDLNGHGTHVAGIASSNSEEYRGVSYNSDLYDVKVLDGDGAGSASNVIEGIEYAVENNAEVITLSLGAEVSECDGNDAISDAVEAAADNGVTVVVAAGNNGPDQGTITAPGCEEKALTVGAVDKQNNLADYSSRGLTSDGRIKPDVVAPGTSITSTYNDGSFQSLSGTSMATPHVSGQTALLIAANSSLTPAQIKAVVSDTATDLGLEDYEQGSGLVNVSKSYNSVTYTNTTGNETRENQTFTPDISNPVPVDGATGINDTVNGSGISADLSVEVTDYDNESVNVTFVVDGEVVSETQIANSTRTETTVSDLNMTQTVDWSVEASDGANTVVSRTYSFTTAAEEPMTENETNRTQLPPGLAKKDELPPGLQRAGMVPGNPFYGFKRAFERAELAVTFNEEKKTEKKLKFAERRLAEAAKLKQRGDENGSRKLAEEYQKTVEEVSKQPGQAEKVRNRTEKHREVLEDVLNKTPDQANQGIERAMNRSETGSKRDTRGPQNRGTNNDNDSSRARDGSDRPDNNERGTDRQSGTDRQKGEDSMPRDRTGDRNPAPRQDEQNNTEDREQNRPSQGSDRQTENRQTQNRPSQNTEAEAEAELEAEAETESGSTSAGATGRANIGAGSR